MTSHMEKLLIVDGHNVIHCTDWLNDIHRQDQELGREKLILELSEFQAMSDFSVVLVFDGKGARRGYEGGNQKDILVIYSKTGETADRVIERIALQQSKKNDVQVISNDRMVLDSCFASGAHGMSVISLWELIDRL